MHWPPWRPDPADVRARKRAEQELRDTLAQRPRVDAAVKLTARHMELNHFLEKALALKGREDS